MYSQSRLGHYGSAKIRSKETIFAVSSFLNMDADVTFERELRAACCR